VNGFEILERPPLFIDKLLLERENAIVIKSPFGVFSRRRTEWRARMMLFCIPINLTKLKKDTILTL
jgi:hypothetical protein